MPELKAPEMPSFKAPEIPEFKAPKFEFEAPKLDKFEAPDIPKFEAPKFEAPKLDNLPSMPKVDMPKVSLPSLPSFGGGGGGGEPKPAATDGDLEPQEVRDGRAKDARNVFLDYDKIAKVNCVCFKMMLCCMSPGLLIYYTLYRTMKSKQGMLEKKPTTRSRLQRILRMKLVRLVREESFFVSVRSEVATRVFWFWDEEICCGFCRAMCLFRGLSNITKKQYAIPVLHLNASNFELIRNIPILRG